MLTHSGRFVFRPLLVSLILFLPASAGCLEVERPCPDNTCFPLTSSAFNSILESMGELDALELASEFEQLSVSTTSRFSELGIASEIKWTVEKDDEQSVAKLLKRIDVDARDSNEYTALILAAETGATKSVGTLLKAGADYDARDSFGRSAVYAAAVGGTRRSANRPCSFRGKAAKKLVLNCPLHAHRVPRALPPGI